MTVPHARTLRIALCKSSLFGPISGADETLVTYVEALRDAGHDARVVLLYPPPERDSYLQRLRQSAIPVHAIADRSLLFRLVRGARTMAARLVLLFALFSRFPGHVRRIWQLLLGLLARLY